MLLEIHRIVQSKHRAVKIFVAGVALALTTHSHAVCNPKTPSAQLGAGYIQIDSKGNESSVWQATPPPNFVNGRQNSLSTQFTGSSILCWDIGNNPVTVSISVVSGLHQGFILGGTNGSGQTDNLFTSDLSAPPGAEQLIVVWPDWSGNKYRESECPQAGCKTFGGTAQYQNGYAYATPSTGWNFYGWISGPSTIWTTGNWSYYPAVDKVNPEVSALSPKAAFTPSIGILSAPIIASGLLL